MYPVVAPVKRVKAAPPALNVYVVGPTLALSFADLRSQFRPTHSRSAARSDWSQRGEVDGVPDPRLPSGRSSHCRSPLGRCYAPRPSRSPCEPVIASGPPVANPLTVAGVVDRSIVTPATPDVAAGEVGRIAAPGRIERVPARRPDTKVVYPRPVRRILGSPQRARSPSPAGPCPSSPPARRSAPCSTPTCTPAAARPGQTCSSAYPRRGLVRGSCPHPRPHRRSCRHWWASPR